MRSSHPRSSSHSLGMNAMVTNDFTRTSSKYSVKYRHRFLHLDRLSLRSSLPHARGRPEKPTILYELSPGGVVA